MVKELRKYYFLASVSLATFLFVGVAAAGKLNLDKLLGRWMWYYNPRDVGGRKWILFLFGLVVILFANSLIKYSEKLKGSRIKNFLLVLVLALSIYALNVSFFVISKYGFDELPQIIMHSGRTSYFTDAAHVDSISDFIKDYPQQLENLTHHSQVHGPGPIILFKLVYDCMDKFLSITSLTITNDFLNLDVAYLRGSLAANGIPGSDAAIATSVFMGLFFPFCASISVIPLFYFVKELSNEKIAFQSCMVYGLFPNVILFTPQLSQMMMLFSSTSIVLFHIGLKRQKLFLIILSSAVVATSFLFSLELLVLILIFFILIVLLDDRVNRLSVDKKQERIQYYKLMALFVIALSIIMILFKVVIGYDSISTYRLSMHIHDVMEVRRPYFKWVWANIIELTVFLGIPASFFIYRKIIVLIRRPLDRKENIDQYRWAVLLSFLVALVVLDISGVNRGEVARLWLFLNPYFAVLAVISINEFCVDVIGKTRYQTHVFLLVASLTLYYTVALKVILVTIPLGAD